MQPAVGKSMATNFVVQARNSPHQTREPLGHPAKYEECTPYFIAIKQRENSLYIPFYSRGIPIPVFIGYF